MICAHQEPNGHWHVVFAVMDVGLLPLHRVCGGCLLVICSHHDDCKPAEAA